MSKKDPYNLYKEIKKVIIMQCRLLKIEKLDMKIKKELMKDYIEKFTNISPKERKKLQELSDKTIETL